MWLQEQGEGVNARDNDGYTNAFGCGAFKTIVGKYRFKDKKLTQTIEWLQENL